jgi:hypothetical protein
MKSLITRTTLTLAAALTLVVASASSVSADHTKALLVNPGPSPSIYLPKFGFDSFNIAGYGERVTSVSWGGLAAQMGLEPGDVILRMNGFPLHYHGSWNDALYQALMNGGFVQLTIRDVRTGWLTTRQTFVGSYGPITPKYHVAGYGPTTSYIVTGNGYPAGPVTTKKMVGPKLKNHVSLNDVIKMFKD